MSLVICHSLRVDILALWSQPKFALDSTDLLFDLSFNKGLAADFSRGAAHPLNQPEQVAQRLVKGLFGQGYAFGGKGSGIAYATGKSADRVSLELYDSHANLFGGSGTMSLWITALRGIDNRDHEYFKADEGHGVLRILRNIYTQHGANYGQAGVGTYDGMMAPGKWMNFVVTFQKGEARVFFNGDPGGIMVNPGVIEPTPSKFLIASESTASAPSQAKDMKDDTIIGEVQIFNRPLTEQEVKSLWERGHQTFDIAGVSYPIWKPKREYAGHAIVAPRLTAPIQPDGQLSHWSAIPAHGGWIERRVGVLDRDTREVRFAVDDKNLYFAFRCEVDASIQSDPMHIKYPLGEFLAGKTARDANLSGDDTVQLVLRGKDGHEPDHLQRPRRVARRARWRRFVEREHRRHEPQRPERLDSRVRHSPGRTGYGGGRNGGLQRHPFLEAVQQRPEQSVRRRAEPVRLRQADAGQAGQRRRRVARRSGQRVLEDQRDDLRPGQVPGQSPRGRVQDRAACRSEGRQHQFRLGQAAGSSRRHGGDRGRARSGR